MKETPIIFSGPMVRAIREGKKTQTRRVIKLNDYRKVPSIWGCPYGQAGDRLWVRETWGIGTRPCPFNGWYTGIEYRADEYYLDGHDLLDCYKVDEQYWEWLEERENGKWKPSIHMPRWASRIDLEVTGIRVERLQEISEEDAIREGMFGIALEDISKGDSGLVQFDPVRAFKLLWDSINGKKYPWESNPLVWVVEFKV